MVTLKTELPKIAIIIPFYQKETGLLQKCIDSIRNQKRVENYEVIVVDDGSPIAAKTELHNMVDGADKITVIEQDNAGPGAARNRGLDNVPEGTRYVAFIDSDDWWTDEFLDTALAGLEQGFDLFFANTQRFGYDRSRFQWKSAIELGLNPANNKGLDTSRHIYQFTGDFFNYMLQRSNIVSTSTLIYRYEKFPDLRFSTKLFNGQDRLFKLSLCGLTDKVAFSTEIHAYEGEGVNIFDSAKWGTPKSLTLIANYIKLSKCILAELQLDKDQKKIVYQQLNESRYAFTASLLHLVKNRGKVDWGLILRTCKTDPGTAIKFLPNVFIALASRYKKSD